MTTDTIKFKRGVKSKLNNLSYGEPAYISDENELYIGTESGVEKLTSNEEVKELSSQLEHIKYQRFNVMDYGAKGDGVTDDSEAIRRCIADLPESNFELIFPPGVYIQGDGTNPHYVPNSSGSYSGDVNMGKPICFDFVSKSNFKIVGYGAEIHSHPNNSCIANNRGFSFINCDNGLVEGIVYIGNIETRRPWGGDGANYNNQHGFKCEGSRYITFYRCKAIGCVMDGFYFGGNGRTYETYSNHIQMIDCASLRNYRQGLSVVNGHYGVLENCLFAETGTIYGTAPKAGVDMEQGYTNYEDRGQRGWMIRNCTFEKNAGDGLALHWGTYESTVTNCVFIENGLFTPDDSENLTRNNTICNNIFYNWKSLALNGGGAHVYNNKFYNNIKSTINIDDSSKVYKKGFCQKQLFYNNYLECDLTDTDLSSSDIDLIQIFFIGEMEIYNNAFMNLTRILSNSRQTALNGASLSSGSIFKNNIIKYNDDRVKKPLCNLAISNSVDMNNNEYSDLFDIRFKRPKLTEGEKGYCLYDDNLLKPIYWNGVNWTDSNGNIV